MKIKDTKGRMLKRFASMSRKKNGRGEWTYMYFWAANHKEAEVTFKVLTCSPSQYMDYKLERIRDKK
jgi:hypothetical protein